MRIMLVDAEVDESRSSAAELLCPDCEIVACANAEDDLLGLVAEHKPDVVIIDMDAPNRDTLESLRTVQSTIPRPMVMFTQDDDSHSIRKAIEVGVSAYVVDGIQAKRLRPILDAAIARFEQHRELVQELDKTRDQLAERKLVEKAKGLIMNMRSVTESEAYELIRKQAMKQNRKLVDVARNIIDAADLLSL